MKYLFIVQGEGRGHMTQAMSLERMLMDRGHQIVEIMVGISPSRRVPDFFLKGVRSRVSYFEGINFTPSADNRKPSMLKSVLTNTFGFHRYMPSIRHVCDRIRSSGADYVVNFYDLIAGLAYLFHEIDVPMICIGHQYLFLHKDFGLPRNRYPDSFALDFYTQMTSVKAVRHLALSFRPMPDDPKRKIVTVPPLLRPEVLQAEPAQGEYIHGYMLNSGFSEDVMQWHEDHPEVELRFFWDNWAAGKISKIDNTLSFYLIDDKEFLRQMAGCKAYASTAGFESVCEAIYMGKPILMVPSHIEQEINAFDASRCGAGVYDDRFDLTLLIEFSRIYEVNHEFRDWVKSAPEVIIRELEKI